MPDIPLVRTDGKSFADGITLTPERIVLGDRTLSRASKSALARGAEDAYGLGDSLYFFVGHACPCFGDVVLIYDSTSLDNQDGGATPFDSGGLFDRKIFAKKWEGLLEKDDGTARCDFAAHNQHSLSGWRLAFDAYLSEYFVRPLAYVHGERPRKDDDVGRMLHPKNSRRAWTWEVRAHRDHPIAEGLRRIWAASDYADAIRQHVLTLDDQQRRDWGHDFGGRIVAAAPGESPHTRAEMEIESWI